MEDDPKKDRADPECNYHIQRLMEWGRPYWLPSHPDHQKHRDLVAQLFKIQARQRGEE